jgi:DNA-directed RNA polymerase II subunit RPB7
MLRLLPAGDDAMQSMFSTGVCFWFIVLRHYLFTFLAFTLVSIHFFHMATVANHEAETSWERLNGISRASLGAILVWGEAKSKAGTVTDADRDHALAAVCLDTVLMLALMVITCYHYWKKDAVRAKVDRQTVTLDDYSVQVSGLPPDATEARVRAHFERIVGGAVHEVTFGRDVGRVVCSFE